MSDWFGSFKVETYFVWIILVFDNQFTQNKAIKPLRHKAFLSIIEYEKGKQKEREQ